MTRVVLAHAVSGARDAEVRSEAADAPRRVSQTIDCFELAPAPRVPTRMAPDDHGAFGEDYAARLGALSNEGEAVHSPEIRYLRDSPTALQARLDLINSARSSLYMSTYAIEADDTTSRVLDALIAAARRGVHVVVKTDAFPMSYVQHENTDEDNERMFRQLRELQAAGGTVELYGDESRHEHVFGAGDHLKIMVADGERAIIGGRNMSSDYFSSWRDLDLEVTGTLATTVAESSLAIARRGDPALFGETYGMPRGPLVEQFQENTLAIARDLAAARRRAEAAGDPGVETFAIAWDPAHDTRETAEGEALNPITQALVETFDRAEHEIIVNCNALNPVPAIREALIRAARRGVTVHCITANERLSDRSLMTYIVAERHYEELRAAGIHIWERDYFEHGKMYYVDGEVAASGSYNLEPAADSHLAEQLVFSRDDGYVERIHQELLGVIESSDEWTGPPDRGFWGTIRHGLWTIPAILLENFI